MTIPSQVDIDKRKEKLNKLLKGLNEDGSLPESKLCTQLRSAIRKVWFQHDVKLSYLNSKVYPDMNDATRTKWLVDCEICGKSMKITDAVVDHIKGEHSLKTLEDLIPFAKSILGVTHKDLQVLDEGCHLIKTLSERRHITFEEASRRKVVIQKMKQTSSRQKNELKSFGYSGKEISNAEKREQCYEELQDTGKI